MEPNYLTGGVSSSGLLGSLLGLGGAGGSASNSQNQDNTQNNTNSLGGGGGTLTGTVSAGGGGGPNNSFTLGNQTALTDQTATAKGGNGGFGLFGGGGGGGAANASNQNSTQQNQQVSQSNPYYNSINLGSTFQPVGYAPGMSTPDYANPGINIPNTPLMQFSQMAMNYGSNK
jgi:hypothetical protein